MAVGLSATEANSLLDTFAATDYPWIQLHTADPGSAGTSSIAGNATRKDTSSAWAAASAGSKATNADIDWTDGEVDSQETYSHFSMWTASTAGTFGASGTLTANQVEAAGDSFSILSGGLTISFAVAA
jgi:hypothetical protein